MINNNQKKAIWAAAKGNGLSKDDVYSVILSISKKEHMTELTYAEAAKVLNKINNRKYGNVGAAGKITGKQIGMIENLAETLGWDDDTLRNHVENRFKISHMTWLSTKQASDCIEGLKGMIMRKQKNIIGM